MTSFQTIVTGIFVAFIVIGVGIFSLFGGFGGGDSLGTVTIWGTMDQSTMETLLTDLSQQDKSLRDVNYLYLSPAEYETFLVNAIAAGTGPDLVFLTQSNAGALSDKTVPMPYSVMPQSSYLSAYIDESQLFLTPQGILAMPLTIDPLVMYWNRDTFTSVGISQPPQYWNDLITLAPKITSLSSGSVRKSAVALGSWDNINNAKAILSALFMQTGDFVTGRNASGALITTLGARPESQTDTPAAGALRFYTDFANPSKTTYSWNRALPNSYNAFASGDVAVYFGMASEYRSIAERNPNLRFGIAVLPQLMGATARITSGNIAGLAVARGARNPSGAVAVAQKLTSAAAIAAISQQTGLPPVRRDVRVDTSASAAAEVFVQSALMARSWVDPSAPATNAIFKTMIESVSSGRSDPEQAVFDAAQTLRQLLPTQ